MSNPIVQAEHLVKIYKTLEGRKGITGAIGNLFSQNYRYIKALNDVSFTIRSGEMVGFIGPNGAGKSTTIKILTGILVPTAGKVVVNQIEPYKERKQNAFLISVVFGQRTKLWWDLPCMESFELHRSMYRIPPSEYKKNVDEFTELLGLDEFWRMPVRQLSLGQRMRAEIPVSLLHNPDVVYLDEPTIGMDAVAKERIRRFLGRINRERGVTVLISSHDMADIETLCPRVMIIDKGELVYDGSLEAIRQQYGRERILVVEFTEEYSTLRLPAGEIIRDEGLKKSIRFSRSEITAIDLISAIGSEFGIRDVSIEEPEIESIIRQIYEDGIGLEPGTD